MLRKTVQQLFSPTPTDGGGSGTTVPAAPATPVQPDAQAAAPKPEGTAPATEPAAEPSAQPKPDEGAAPVAGKDDPLLQALFRDIQPEEPAIKPVSEEEPKPEAKAEDPAPATEPPKEPAAPKAEEKPKATRKKKASVMAELDSAPVAPVQPPATPPPASATPPADPDQDYVANLTSDQKEELAEAEYAERLFGDKYKGRKKALIKWYRELDSTASRLLAEDPERKLTEEDAEFQKFLRTKPRLEAAHAKAIQRAIGEDAAVKRVQEEYAPKLTQLERKQQEIEFRPKIEGVVQEFTSGIQELLSQDEKSPLALAARFAKEKGEAEAAKEFPLETQIRNEEVGRAADMTREYFLFAKQLRAFDPQNPTHAALLKFINEEGERFIQHGGQLLVRDGKRFLPRQEYMKLASSNPAEAARHWTFSHRDIIEMLAFQTKISIENRLKAEEDRARAMGFERRARNNSANAPKSKEPEPLNPPKATPTPAKGPASATREAKGAGQAKGEPIDVVSALRLRG